MARRTSTTSGVVLSHLEFDLLWEDLADGEPPYPLEVPSHGATLPERDALGSEVFAGLEEAGLVRGEELDTELERMFEVLDRPLASVDALIFGAHSLRMLAAGDGERAVLAVLDEREVALEPLAMSHLTTAIANVIGELPAGPGEPVRVPRTAFSAAMDAYARTGYDGFERALADAGVTGRAVRAFATITGSGRTAAGQVAANGRGGRSPILSWYDTEAGRYAVTVETVNGEQLATLTPADGTWMARRLAGLLDTVHR
ncbi:ESX secretion-associated protein EspG [Saccharothrix sp. AJ9571]|nr:ESX secretion-associated protein EspG [Saccharothrix sp. AJ9571]